MKKPKPWHKVFEGGREVLNRKTLHGIKLYRHRVQLMLKRQEGQCCLYGIAPMCGGGLSQEDATFDHEHGRGMGGAKRDDRIYLPSGEWINGAAHSCCNVWKGSRYYPYNAGERWYHEEGLKGR